MTPLKHSKNLAARMGRWSAEPLEDRRLRLARVRRRLAVFVGMQLGTKYIDQNDANVGESRTADRIIDDAGFTVDKNGESVEEQSARWCSSSRRR